MAYISVRIPGFIRYQDALTLQHKFHEMVEQHVFDGVLMILEHAPVFTMGIRTDEANLLVSSEVLEDAGIELYHTDRGGDITFHGPGQIVAYPILRFREFGLRLSDYMHQLEEVVIQVLSNYGVPGNRKEGYPGVWVNDTKICAIGVRAKRYITYHGLAFNVMTDKSYFNYINPCGITTFQVSSLSDFHSNPTMEDVKSAMITQFNHTFGVTFREQSLDEIENLSKLS